MSSGSTDQSDGAAERSAHVTRGSKHAVSSIDPLVGPDYGPIKLRVVAVLEAQIEELKGERDHLLALLKVEREASFNAGAEAMREAAARELRGLGALRRKQAEGAPGAASLLQRAADLEAVANLLPETCPIRALPIPERKP